jgi:hypothetical protein
MRIDKRWILVLTTLFLPLLLAGTAYADTSYRWDIVRLSLTGVTHTINPGGPASAKANDGSMITVTGSGTFTIGDDEVSGGGTWTTTAADGTTITGMGSYLVTALVRFDVAPGKQTNGTIDLIGDGTLADNRAGLVFLRVLYDDGSKGILVVSCRIAGNPGQGDAAPASMFEGITASKGFVDYWNNVAPTGGFSGPNAGRTLFHILRGGD